MTIASPSYLRSQTTEPDIKILNKSIERVFKINHLGVTIDDSLKWDKHIKGNFNSCLSKTLKKRQKSHRINNLYATNKKFSRQLPIVQHCWKIIYNLWLECSPVLEMNVCLVL